MTGETFLYKKLQKTWQTACCSERLRLQLFVGFFRDEVDVSCLLRTTWHSEASIKYYAGKAPGNR